MPNISKIILPNGTQCNLNDSRVNSSTSAGVVASGAGQSHKIWMTDGNGNPAWRPVVSMGTFTDASVLSLAGGWSLNSSASLESVADTHNEIFSNPITYAKFGKKYEISHIFNVYQIDPTKKIMHIRLNYINNISATDFLLSANIISNTKNTIIAVPVTKTTLNSQNLFLINVGDFFWTGGSDTSATSFQIHIQGWFTEN